MQLVGESASRINSRKLISRATGMRRVAAKRQ